MSVSVCYITIESTHCIRMFIRLPGKFWLENRHLFINIHLYSFQKPFCVATKIKNWPFVIWIDPLMTMNVLVATEHQYSPYSLRPKNDQKYQRYPLRSISNSCGRSNKQPKRIQDTIRYVSKLKFSLMNDNCILYVLENLPLADLCNVAEVSVRLKQLAQYTFRLKYMNGAELSLNSLANGREKITMKQVRSLFYNFGEYIKSLHVSRKQFEFDSPLQRPFLGQQKLFHLIGKYCSLETLTIGHFWFNAELMHEALPIFGKLRTLNFYRIICYCTDEKAFHHFANVLPLALVNEGHPTPQMVQLI